jgi:hypothetical protein
VTQGRFTDEELKCYEMVSKEIFEEKASDYLTIVRTDFSNFSNKEECEKDIRKIREETDEEGQVNQARIKMINSCKAFVHISNPPLNIAKGTSNDTNDGDTSDEESKEEERKSKISLNKKERQRSRKKLLNHLKKCEKTYKTK